MTALTELPIHTPMHTSLSIELRPKKRLGFFSIVKVSKRVGFYSAPTNSTATREERPGQKMHLPFVSALKGSPTDYLPLSLSFSRP